ncbi:hypothetical protein D3C75_1027240 [compost metagenome]
MRLEVAQAQLHTVVGELPGTIDFAFDGVDQVHPVGKILLCIQWHREAQGQCAGTIDLNFRDIHHAQFATGITLGQGRGVFTGRLGGFLSLRRRRGRSRGWLVWGRRVAGAEQGQHAGQQQSFVEHG